MTGPQRMKRCAECREVKNARNFNRLTSARDGLDHLCAACRRARTKQNRISRGVGYSIERIEADLRKEAATAARQALEDKRRTLEAFERLQRNRQEIAGV